MEDSGRRLIPDASTFHQMGYDLANVVNLPAADLALIPEGQPLPSTAAQDEYQKIVDQLISIANKAENRS